MTDVACVCADPFYAGLADPVTWRCLRCGGRPRNDGRVEVVYVDRLRQRVTLLTEAVQANGPLALDLMAARAEIDRLRAEADKLALAASAMRKMLPPALLADVVAHLDPLGEFVRFLREEPVNG